MCCRGARKSQHGDDAGWQQDSVRWRDGRRQQQIQVGHRIWYQHQQLIVSPRHAGGASLSGDGDNAGWQQDSMRWRDVRRLQHIEVGHLISVDTSTPTLPLVVWSSARCRQRSSAEHIPTANGLDCDACCAPSWNHLHITNISGRASVRDVDAYHDVCQARAAANVGEVGFSSKSWESPCKAARDERVPNPSWRSKHTQHISLLTIKHCLCFWSSSCCNE